MSKLLFLNKHLIKDRSAGIPFSILIVMAVWGPVIQMLMLFSKYAGLPYFEAADIMKFGASIIILYGIFLNISLKKNSFDYLYIIIFTPLLVGLFNLTIDNNDRRVEFFIIHLAGSVLIFSAISAFSKSGINVSIAFVRAIDQTVIISLIITFLYLLIYSLQALSDYLYFGPSTGILLVAFPWFFLRKKPKLAILCILLIFLGGKRAVMVSLIFEIILLFALFGKVFFKFFTSLFLKFIFILTGIYLFILYLVPDIEYSIMSDFMDLALNRILGSIEGFSDDPNKISSGRFAEIEASLNFYSRNIFNILFGLGFGWSFFWLDESLHFLHFSPINFLYQYGVIIFAVLAIIFLKCVISFYGHYKKNKDIVFGTLFVIFIGQLVEGFFSYMYVANPQMWCIFGLLVAVKRKNIILKSLPQ